MELYFNELSMLPLTSDKYRARELMNDFSKVVAMSRQKGFKNIKSDLFEYQINLSEDYTLKDWLNDKEVSPELRNQLFGFMIPPFIRDEDEAIMTEFIGGKFYYEATDLTQTSCIGIAAAYLYESMSISLCTSKEWKNHKLPLTIEKEAIKNVVDVFNVYGPTSFLADDIIAYLEEISPVVLKKTQLAPTDKKISLFGDHHGKVELKELSEKLIHNDYVVEIRSTNFGGSKFVRKIQPDGVIELVILKTDKRVALWVQTTGENYRETKEIADHLRRRYS